MSSNRARDNHDDVEQLKYQRRRRRRRQHTDQVKTESMALQLGLFFAVFYRFLFRFFLLIIYLSVFSVSVRLFGRSTHCRVRICMHLNDFVHRLLLHVCAWLLGLVHVLSVARHLDALQCTTSPFFLFFFIYLTQSRWRAGSGTACLMFSSLSECKATERGPWYECACACRCCFHNHTFCCM